jgi:hypothetical protein
MLRRAVSLIATGALAVGVTACGSGGSHHSGRSGPAASSNPTALLRQTFAATHSVKSGVLALSLEITPRGSSQLSTPISVSLGGPFQSASGRSAQSALTIAFSGLGKHSSLGVTTTTSGAYVTIQGTSYKLPDADFKKLQSSLGAKGTGSEPGLSSFGIDPEDWLSHPRIIGTATVDGVVTEHLHADVDVRAFVLSLGKVLTKESSTLRSAAGGTGKLPTHITSSQASKIAAAVRAPTVDIYTGKNDSTLRRLVIDATLPVHGTLSSELGGLSSASLRMTIDYSHLGQPQTISAPAHARSFSALQTRLEALGQGLTGATAGASSGSSGQVSKYATCIQKANGQVAKMQGCAALLGSAG